MDVKEKTGQTVWALFALGLMVLSACASPEGAITPVPLPSATVSPSSSAVPSLTPSPSRTPELTLTPSPSPSPTPACQEVEGRIESQSIANDLLGYPLAVTVYLPPCYRPSSRSGYPLLVLLHGQSMDAQVWQRVGALQAADRLISAGDAPPFIIAMPSERYYLQDVGESKFGRAVGELLLPWLERTYPLCAERSCRAVGGISRGAVWAMQVGFIYWEQFGAIGAHSLPSYPFSSGRLLALSRRLAPEPLPRLYLDTGELDRYRKSATQFEALLVQLKIPHEWHLFAGAHDESYWAAQIEGYLRWYTAPWQNDTH